MKKEKLIFGGISEIRGSDGMGLIILLYEKKQRQLSIVCDKTILLRIQLRIEKSSVTKILLPEVLARQFKNNAELQYELIIDGIVDEQYRTLLYNTKTIESTLIRTSDAVLLSLIMSIPIYIESSLMSRQSAAYKKDIKGVSIPINTISDTMLSKALDKAIKEENYELASRLRDEILRRKNRQHF